MLGQLGHPHHGLVINGTLLLPNGDIISCPGITNGDTQLVSLPNSPAISRTPAQQAHDQAQGFEWRNYAIIADNHLGGVNLGPGWLLYVDPNQVAWYLKLSYQAYDNECVMGCSLQGVFGRFNRKYRQVSRALAHAQTKLIPSGVLIPLNRFCFERKPDGSEVLIHVYAKLDNGNTIEFPESMSLYEIWQLKLDGAGLLTDDDSLGMGIKATISRLKSFEEVQSQVSRNIPRIEKRFKLGKTNLTEGYYPKPAIPPECASNIFQTKFDLELIPDGKDYVPFSIDKNTYVQTKWHGQEEVKTAIVRMLYDAQGNINTLGIQRKSQKLNRYHQGFKGSGSGKSAPIEYEFNQYVCVPRGMGFGVLEEYQGTQKVDVRFKKLKSASLLLDGVAIQTLSLKGECKQTAKTVIGQPVINAVKVEVKYNDRILRRVEGKSQEISNAILADPFSGILPSDDIDGVFVEYHFGLIANNLLGQFATRRASSDSFKVTRKISNAVISCGAGDSATIINDKNHVMNGSYNPFTKDIIRYEYGVQCWV